MACTSSSVHESSAVSSVDRFFFVTQNLRCSIFIIILRRSLQLVGVSSLCYQLPSCNSSPFLCRFFLQDLLSSSFLDRAGRSCREKKNFSPPACGTRWFRVVSSLLCNAAGPKSSCNTLSNFPASQACHNKKVLGLPTTEMAKLQGTGESLQNQA